MIIHIFHYIYFNVLFILNKSSTPPPDEDEEINNIHMYRSDSVSV